MRTHVWSFEQSIAAFCAASSHLDRRIRIWRYLIPEVLIFKCNTLCSLLKRRRRVLIARQCAPSAPVQGTEILTEAR